MNTNAVRRTVRLSAQPAVSTPFRDLLGFIALSAGLGAGLLSLVGTLAYLSAGAVSGLQTFLGPV